MENFVVNNSAKTTENNTNENIFEHSIIGDASNVLALPTFDLQLFEAPAEGHDAYAGYKESGDSATVTSLAALLWAVGQSDISNITVSTSITLTDNITGASGKTITFSGSNSALTGNYGFTLSSPNDEITFAVANNTNTQKITLNSGNVTVNAQRTNSGPTINRLSGMAVDTRIEVEVGSGENITTTTYRQINSNTLIVDLSSGTNTTTYQVMLSSNNISNVNVTEFDPSKSKPANSNWATAISSWASEVYVSNDDLDLSQSTSTVFAASTVSNASVSNNVLTAYSNGYNGIIVHDLKIGYTSKVFTLSGTPEEDSTIDVTALFNPSNGKITFGTNQAASFNGIKFSATATGTINEADAYTTRTFRLSNGTGSADQDFVCGSTDPTIVTYMSGTGNFVLTSGSLQLNSSPKNGIANTGATYQATADDPAYRVTATSGIVYLDATKGVTGIGNNESFTVNTGTTDTVFKMVGAGQLFVTGSDGVTKYYYKALNKDATSGTFEVSFDDLDDAVGEASLLNTSVEYASSKYTLKLTEALANNTFYARQTTGNNPSTTFLGQTDDTGVLQALLNDTIIDTATSVVTDLSVVVLDISGAADYTFAKEFEFFSRKTNCETY